MTTAHKKTLKETYPELAAQMVDQELAQKILPGSGKKVKWRCDKNPDHTWVATPNNRTATIKTRGHAQGCPVCAGRRIVPGENDLTTLNPELAAELLNPDEGQHLAPNSNKVVEWVCRKHGEEFIWKAAVNNRASGGNGCPVCAGNRSLPGITTIDHTHPELVIQMNEPDQATALTKGSHEKVTWRCERGHTWRATVKDRVRGTDCPTCSCNKISRKEKELLAVVKKLASEDVLENFELIGKSGKRGGSINFDIVIPSKKIAIEFNGLYWHTESKGKNNVYHLNKTRIARTVGYQLIHIWEDDWTTNRELVIRSLAHKLHSTDTLATVLPDLDPKATQREPARKMRITLVDSRTAREFLKRNHLQGAVSATYHYGLLDSDGDVRALLSVRSPRNNARMHRADGVWEVQRYATCGIVPGGFSRLLSHAEKHIRSQNRVLTQWVSFSANDISDGGMYLHSGFVKDAELRPDYKYVGNYTRWVRQPKEKYQKSKFAKNPDLLWEEGWTEREAAEANNLHRIYDAGKIRWIKNIEETN